MIRSTIKEISQAFIREALTSPTLMEDMAAMEKYMAESYGERIFVELLQNADDAQSNRANLVQKGRNLYFANDGRPFNKDDILGISRSGTSHKKRGKSIGYRGVGFKSTSYLSNRILIYSGGTYFTYSKEMCAQVLGVESNKVPTIRIPFLIEECTVDTDIHQFVQTLVDDGFTTIFIFVEAQLRLMEEELKEINNGYFLFLKHLTFTKLEIGDVNMMFKIRRDHKVEYSLVTIEGHGIYKWWLYHSQGEKQVSLAFLLNSEGKAIPCNNDEAVFHCYLPTLEKTGYSFKINSDFSTDPSRKHLSMDDETQKAIQESAHAIFDLLSGLVKNEYSGYPSELLDLIDRKLSFSKFSMMLSEHVKRLIIQQAWLPLSTGEFIYPTDYIREPSWLEPSEFQIIARYSSYVQKRRLPIEIYEDIPNLHSFLTTYSTKEYQLEDWVEVLKEKELVESINQRLYGKLWGHIMKYTKLKSTIRGTQVDLSECLVPVDQQVVPLMQISQGKPLKVSSDFHAGLMESVSAAEAMWFDQNYSTKFSKLLKIRERATPVIEITSTSQELSKGITKWRAAEQQCVELEELWGNSAKDVSKQNLGYDVVSNTPDGETRYIEVKLMGKNTRAFTLTNNEFSAAHQLGKNYFICLISQDESQFKAIYVQDPVHTLSLEKRVRQWEWFCEEFQGEQYTVRFN